MMSDAGTVQTEAISLTVGELATHCSDYACDVGTLIFTGQQIEALLKRADSLLSQVDVPPGVLKLIESYHQEILHRIITLTDESKKNMNQLLELVAGKIGHDTVETWTKAASFKAFDISENVCSDINDPQKEQPEPERYEQEECAEAEQEEEGTSRKSKRSLPVSDSSGSEEEEATAPLAKKPRNKQTKVSTTKDANASAGIDEEDTSTDPAEKPKAKTKRRRGNKEMKQSGMKRDELLAEGKTRFEQISFELKSHPTVVKPFPLLELVISEIDCAFDSKHPQLSRISTATGHLIRFLRELSKYNQMLREYQSSFNQLDELTHLDNILMSVKSSATVGSLLHSISKYTKGEVCDEDKTMAKIKQKLSSIKTAMQRSEIGGMKFLRSSSADVTKDDISSLRKILSLKQECKNLLWNCLHLLVIGSVESNLTIHQLFMHEKNEDCINDATRLWNAIKPEEEFDPSAVSMQKYREQVVLPAFALDEEKYNAFGMACLMSKRLTHTALGKGSERKDMILPLFRNALNKSLDGGVGNNRINDYCGGDDPVHAERRIRMALLTFNLTAHSLIEQHMVEGILPYGVTRSIIVQSPTFIRESCSFHNYKDFFVRDEAGQPVVHGIENEIVDGIASQLVGYDIQEQTIIVDSDSVDTLSEMLED